MNKEEVFLFKRTELVNGIIEYSVEESKTTRKHYFVKSLLVAGALSVFFKSLWIGFLCGCMYILMDKMKTSKESLLVMQNLGLELKRSNHWFHHHRRFIPLDRIHSLFINEGIRGMEVRYYMGICIKDEEEIAVAFESLPLTLLKSIYKQVNSCL
jgi:hypothetical protein